MATQKPFPQAGILMRLQAFVDGASCAADESLGPMLASLLWPPLDHDQPGKVVAALLATLQARRARVEGRVRD